MRKPLLSGEPLIQPCDVYTRTLYFAKAWGRPGDGVTIRKLGDIVDEVDAGAARRPLQSLAQYFCVLNYFGWKSNARFIVITKRVIITHS